jgi:thiamine-phosphate diphosphorylase
MDAPRLIAITDTALAPTHLLLHRVRLLCAQCRPRSVMVQLRDRELGVRERLCLGELIAESTRASDQILCINDRLDLAMLLDAQALHLGENSFSPRDVRQHVGDRFWLTRASHDPIITDAEGADAILLSPIISTRKGAPALGIDAIKLACKTLRVPVYALGGVGADNAAACLAAGARGIAAIGAWLATDSLLPLVQALGIGRDESAHPNLR